MPRFIQHKKPKKRSENQVNQFNNMQKHRHPASMQNTQSDSKRRSSKNKENIPLKKLEEENKKLEESNTKLQKEVVVLQEKVKAGQKKLATERRRNARLQDLRQM